MYRYFFILFLSVVLLSGCSSESNNTNNSKTDTLSVNLIKEGHWRLALNLGEEELPVNAVIEKDSSYVLKIINAKEEIVLNDFTVLNDSVIIKTPLFDSEFRGKIINDSLITGLWFNFDKGSNYSLPFALEYNNHNRFITEEAVEPKSVVGGWEVDFSPSSNNHYRAKGIFEQVNGELHGTFLTETGDYRFLQGVEVNNKIYLSAFDGSHAFLFKGDVNEFGNIEGYFWSGSHWKENWIAKRNDHFELTHPDSLTYMRKGERAINFSLYDIDSNLVSLKDEKYKNKVVIVQIMGSWCPNCADEMKFYNELYKKYHSLGFEIITIGFETTEDFKIASSRIRKMKDFYGCEYDFLVSGKVGKASASQLFPQVNQITSFPTSFFIDKKGKVRKIHTGFYGPGTGMYYENYVSDTYRFIDRLLRE